jgi:DNA mismatch endonuclease (patch repair protein)
MTDWLTKEQRSRNMAAIRSSGTNPEKRLGLLLKLLLPSRRIVVRPNLPGKPDYYVPGLKLAIFADGCFWHGCLKHGRIPEDNRSYWMPKLVRNKEKDRLVARDLRRQRIRVIRIWEHDLKGSMVAARLKIRRAFV